MPFWKQRDTRREKGDGHSPETAFVLAATSPDVGIPLEYTILERLFGRQDIDWRLHERNVSQRADGHFIEKFIVGARGIRREVYFDITSWYGNRNSEPGREIIGGALDRISKKPLTIDIPAGSMLVMMSLLMDHGPSLSRAGGTFDFKKITNKALLVCKEFHLDEAPDLADQRMIPVDLDGSDWVGIYSLLRLAQSADLVVAERMEDLKAFIENGLKTLGAEE